MRSIDDINMNDKQMNDNINNNNNNESRDHVKSDTSNNNDNNNKMNGCNGETHLSPPYHHLHDRPPKIEEKKCDASQESQQQQQPSAPPPFTIHRSLLWKNEASPRLPETRDPSIGVQDEEDEEGVELPLRRILSLPTSSSSKLSPAMYSPMDEPFSTTTSGNPSRSYYDTTSRYISIIIISILILTTPMFG